MKYKFKIGDIVRFNKDSNKSRYSSYNKLTKYYKKNDLLIIGVSYHMYFLKFDEIPIGIINKRIFEFGAIGHYGNNPVGELGWWFPEEMLSHSMPEQLNLFKDKL